tara:strand:- start:2493 stop:3509 length:1017 start_codon:yes stop_codon:yes gene_type:complete
MTKFLDKKEQVIDLKLTTYGHYLMSIGTFKPVYYAFFDNNIIYDGACANISESQNDIFDRIKHNTPYVEGQTLFADLEGRISNADPVLNHFSLDVTPTKEEVRPNMFRYDKAIGDAHLNGRELDLDAAWKIVLLNGTITNTRQRDDLNNMNVPQIDVELYYKKIIREGTGVADDINVYNVIDETTTFVDDQTVAIQSDDLVLYVEEMNTDLLSKNFEIEIFEIVTGSYLDSEGNIHDSTSSFKRKYFDREVPQIVDGIMRMPRQIENVYEQIPSSSVNYYFDIYTDSLVDQTIACRGLSIYNKQSYYIDLDLDCEGTEDEDIYFDIYGTGAEPEICLD